MAAAITDGVTTRGDVAAGAVVAVATSVSFPPERGVAETSGDSVARSASPAGRTLAVACPHLCAKYLRRPRPPGFARDFSRRTNPRRAC